MPEIAEVARVVHFLRLHLVGKRVRTATATDDASVFGKVGTTGAEVAAALKGKKVVSAGSQGKYFWLVLEKPPHLVMHLGMTGWVHIRGVKSAYTNYYKKMKPGDEDLWPPKYSKLQLETEGPDKAEVAYVDPRRFGRIRLVDCPGAEIRKHSPLVENGPDPVVDADVFTEKFLADKMRARRVPIKALLLDQAVISGIGNWVGDEVLFQARLHPEQYSHEFTDAEVRRLYEAVRHVCGTAVAELGDSDRFPDDWIFNHRWGKGSKSASRLPSGEKLAFVTVGGRTSCYAPDLQKKTGKVAPGIKEEVPNADDEPTSPLKTDPKAEDVEEKDEKRVAKRRRVEAKPETKVTATQKRPKANSKHTTEPPAPPSSLPKEAVPGDSGRRRSGRLRGKTAT